MPPDLDIDVSKTLDGSIAAYSEHIIISTGQADWKSKIEDEKEMAPWGNVVSSMKTMLGPKGRYHDVSATPDYGVIALTDVHSHIVTQ